MKALILFITVSLLSISASATVTGKTPVLDKCTQAALEKILTSSKDCRGVATDSLEEITSVNGGYVFNFYDGEDHASVYISGGKITSWDAESGILSCDTLGGVYCLSNLK